MRISFQRFVKAVRNTRKLFETQIRNYHRSITGDRVTELNEKTLTGRLLTYLNNDKTTENLTLNTRVPFEDHINALRGSKIPEIITTIKSLGVGQNVYSKFKSLQLLNALDDECCRRVKHLEARELLSILHAYMITIPNRIVEYKYYNTAMKELVKKIDTLSRNELVQLIFYIGLGKKLVKRQLLRRCINTFDETSFGQLTAEELCVICNASFKTSTKIDNTIFLDKITRYLNDNLSLLQDPALFITFLKTIRHNRYQSEDLLATISCTIFFNKTLDYYSFAALCHILAAYSDFLYFDENVLKAFTDRCIVLLKENKFISKNEYTLDIPRLKDIKRLLWCLSNLNYNNIEKTDLENVIVPNILERVMGGEVESNRSSLIEIMLYLWMLNYRAYDLVPYALGKENLQFVKASNSPTKHRLNLLLSCIFYEDRSLFKDLNILPDFTSDYDTKYQIEKRPLLEKLAENLRVVGAVHELNKFEMRCQVPCLNIIGITGYRKNIYKTVHIELLDDYTSMKNVEGVPTGLMQLKLRILDGQDEGVIVIQANDIEELTDKEMQQFLLEELELVC